VEKLEFVDMVSLEFLILNGNKLIEVNFNELPNLQSLSMNNNQFV
jgi:Leucine-rich repeat (LRR) protein